MERSAFPISINFSKKYMWFEWKGYFCHHCFFRWDISQHANCIWNLHTYTYGHTPFINENSLNFPKWKIRTKSQLRGLHQSCNHFQEPVWFCLETREMKWSSKIQFSINTVHMKIETLRCTHFDQNNIIHIFWCINRITQLSHST